MSQRNYPSKYSPDGKADAPCWLAEMICENIAFKEKTTLRVAFYKEDAWKKKYALEIQHARALLKQYELKAIGNAIRRYGVRKRLFSLACKWFHDIVKEEQRKLTVENKILEDKVATAPERVEPPPEASKTPRPAFKTKKSALDKLKDL